jgi:hypothetical protein
MVMDIARIDFTVLDVGQGACNYVEFYNSAGAVAYNILADLGTNSRFAAADPALNWLAARIAPRPDPKINVVLLTHGDTDHFNLLSRLLAVLGVPSQQQIGMVRYGGNAGRYTVSRQFDPNRSLIAALMLYSPDVQPLGINWSSYDPLAVPPASAWTSIWPTWQVDGAVDPLLYVFRVNTPHNQDHTLTRPRRKDHNAEAINAKSLVFGVYWQQRLFVGTGDATAATFASVNARIPVLTIPTLSMTMPHHGSRKTTYELTAADNLPTGGARAVVANFLNIFKPWTISISADEKGHHHPSLFTLNDFLGGMTPKAPYWSDPLLGGQRHYLMSWVDQDIAPMGDPRWPASWRYSTLETATNLYCTLYFSANQQDGWIAPPIPGTDTQEVLLDAHQMPPRGRNWVFQTIPNDFAMNSWPNYRVPGSTRLMSFAAAPPAAAPARNAAARTATATAAERPQDGVRVRPRGGPRLRGELGVPAGPTASRLHRLKPIA